MKKELIVTKKGLLPFNEHGGVAFCGEEVLFSVEIKGELGENVLLKEGYNFFVNEVRSRFQDEKIKN